MISVPHYDVLNQPGRTHLLVIDRRSGDKFHVKCKHLEDFLQTLHNIRRLTLKTVTLNADYLRKCFKVRRRR
jgi:hypothetical protein